MIFHAKRLAEIIKKFPKKKTEAAPSGTITVEVSEEQGGENTPYDMFLLAAPGLLAVSWLGYRFIVEKKD